MADDKYVRSRALFLCISVPVRFDQLAQFIVLQVPYLRQMDKTIDKKRPLLVGRVGRSRAPKSSLFSVACVEDKLLGDLGNAGLACGGAQASQ